MRCLGIDYGRRRVGLALSDPTGRIAYPYAVIKNSGRLSETIAAICAKERVEQIVIGDSRNYRGNENPIMPEVRQLSAVLAAATGLPIADEPEFLTSIEAERLIGRDQELDARAAALILKSYLDRCYNTGK